MLLVHMFMCVLSLSQIFSLLTQPPYYITFDLEIGPPRVFPLYICTLAPLKKKIGKNADLHWLPMCVSMTTLQEATARHFCTEIYQWK